MHSSVHMRQRVFAGLCAAFISLFPPMFTLTAQQQDNTSAISGIVVDSHGAAIPHAAIFAKNQSTGAHSQALSDSTGQFKITAIPEGRYTVVVTANGFVITTQKDVPASAGPTPITLTLSIAGASENVEVSAIAGNSLAAQQAFSQNSLDSEFPKSEISSSFIREFTPPTADYAEIINIAPGTISYNSNGVGLGQGTIYFRGFIDGDFNLTWDGIPEGDTNNFTHHSWVYFPGPWIGGVDFDRSPGTASTIGPANYGGSINLLSQDVPSEQSIQPEVAYGSFNTLLIDGHYNTGMLGPKKNIGVIVDVHRLSTDGFETFNDMQRNAGMIKVFYKLSDRTTITGFRGVVGALPNGAPYITTDRGFGSALPSASANYHIFPNWSVYGDFGKGDEIPPTSLFDVAGGGPEVGTVGSPMMTTAYQGGTVAKLNRFTLGADVFRVKFQNNYIAYTVPSSNPAYNLNEYYLGSDSYTLGFEAEANAALGYGFHLYANGTVDKANYTGTGVPSGLNVAATPSYTQDLALTYQAHGLDLGVVEKRVGTYYDDNGTYHNQAYVAPYNNVNLFFNYTIRKHSFFDESKIGFSVNNLFNSENITDVIAFGNNPLPVGSSTYFASTPISPIDQPNLTAGRSFTVTFKLGIFPGRHM